MGTIFQRKEGGPFYIRYYDPGRRYTVIESTYSKNRKKAERDLRERESAKDNCQPIASAKARSILCAQLFDLLIADYKNNNRKSLYTVEKRIKKHLSPFFKNLRASAVSTALVEEYKSKRISQTPKPKPGTINRELASLRTAFNLAHERSILLYVPVIKDLEEHNIREGYYTAENLLKLLAELPEELRGLFEWAYCTGVRKSQSLSLKWNQVDRINSVVRFGSHQTKNKLPHEIHYADNPDVVQLIEKQWKKKTEIESRSEKRVEFVFFRFAGTKAGQQIKDFRETFKSACKRAEISYGRFSGKIFHDFRKTAATNMRLAGVPETVVMMVTGHQTREVFERYNMKDPVETKKALSKVGIAREIQNIEYKNEYKNKYKNNEEEPIITKNSDTYESSSRRNIQ